MIFFTNLFLMLFLLDAQLSCVDELLSLLETSNLSEIRSLLASAVLFLSLPMYLSLGFTTRLPKRVFLPLTLFVLWCPLVAWIYPSLGEIPGFGLAIALMQFLLFILPLRHIRGYGGETLLMTEEMLPPRPAPLANTLLFWGGTLLIVPVTVAMIGLATLNAYVEGGTAGFVHLRPGGLYMTERVYRNEGKTIRLIGMIHVGDRKYYDSLASSFAASRTVVLAEGVTDRQNLLKSRVGYGKVASFLGLASQETMRLKGRLLDTERFAGGEEKGGEGGTPDIVRADVDIDTFQPSTVEFLNVLGRYLSSGAPVPEQLRGFFEWAEENVTPEMNQTIMNDILHGRNRKVIGHLDTALSRYDTVVIPWGALHMAEIEAEVRRRGFVLQEERERESIDFPGIISHRLK